VVCSAAALQRCLLVRTTWYEVMLLPVASFLLIKPELKTDLIGASGPRRFSSFFGSSSSA